MMGGIDMDENTLVILKHERFSTQFYYDSDTNIMGENLFNKFNLPRFAVMRKALAVRLYSLVPILEYFHLKILFKEVLRFYEMQKYLYEHWLEKTGQEPKLSLANVDSSPHARGIAFDCVLTDESGGVLQLPSSSIRVKPEQRNSDYMFENTLEEKKKEHNRNFLRHLMLGVGISPINKEWFHFQLPDMCNYSIVSAEDVKNAIAYPFNENEIQFLFYDIPCGYKKDIFAGKTNFWIDNSDYFKQFEKIGEQVFIHKLQKVKSSNFE